MNPRFPSFFKRALLATALLGTGQAFAADSVVWWSTTRSMKR